MQTFLKPQTQLMRERELKKVGLRGRVYLDFRWRDWELKSTLSAIVLGELQSSGIIFCLHVPSKYIPTFIMLSQPQDYWDTLMFNINGLVKVPHAKQKKSSSSLFPLLLHHFLVTEFPSLHQDQFRNRFTHIDVNIDYTSLDYSLKAHSHQH